MVKCELSPQSGSAALRQLNPIQKWGHNFFQSLSTGRGEILLNGKNALSVTKILCWRSPMSSSGLLSALSVLYVFLRFCFFLLCSFLLVLFFSVFVSPLYLVLPSVLFSHSLCIHLFSDLLCCFVFKSAILLFSFPMTLFCLLLTYFLFLFNFILYASLFSLFYSCLYTFFGKDPMILPVLSFVFPSCLFSFSLFSFCSFWVFCFLFALVFIIFLFRFSTSPLFCMLLFTLCSHCLFFVRHSYRVVTTWRGVFLTSRTFFKAKNNIRYILNVD